MIYGVDYSTDHPSPTCLKSNGVRFVCRYVGPGSEDKLLEPSETVVLELAGLGIVSLVEDHEEDALLGFSQGVTHASMAKAWHLERAYPWPVPLYAAVDFQVTAAQWGAVRDYFHGFASVVGLQWTGIYGGIDAIRWARADDVARWFFQTYAWSGGQWEPGNNIEQYQNGVFTCGGTVDLDRSPNNNPGVWNVTQPTNPTNDVELDLYATVAAIAAGDDKATRKGSTLDMDLTPMWNRITANTALANMIDATAASILATTASKTDVVSIGSRLDAMRDEIVALADGPAVDAVAVAKALIADAGFVSALGAAIAAQLPSYQGELTLSGPVVLTTQAPRT